MSCADVGWASRTLDATGKPHGLDLFRTAVGIDLIGTFNVRRLAAAAMPRTALVDGERGVVVTPRPRRLRRRTRRHRHTASVAAFDGERGVIVDTASAAAFVGQIGQIGQITCAASRAGVVGMTLPAARDLAPSGIRVVTIAPDLFDTPMLAAPPEDERAALAADVVFATRLSAPAGYGELVAAIVGNGRLDGEAIRRAGSLRMAPR